LFVDGEVPPAGHVSTAWSIEGPGIVYEATRTGFRMSVATTAFGMNVVQPDVRFMLHTNISDRLTLPGDRPSRP